MKALTGGGGCADRVKTCYNEGILSRCMIFLNNHVLGNSWFCSLE